MIHGYNKKMFKKLMLSGPSQENMTPHYCNKESLQYAYHRERFMYCAVILTQCLYVCIYICLYVCENYNAYYITEMCMMTFFYKVGSSFRDDNYKKNS